PVQQDDHAGRAVPAGVTDLEAERRVAEPVHTAIFPVVTPSGQNRRRRPAGTGTAWSRVVLRKGPADVARRCHDPACASRPRAQPIRTKSCPPGRWRAGWWSPPCWARLSWWGAG